MIASQHPTSSSRRPSFSDILLLSLTLLVALFIILLLWALHPHAALAATPTPNQVDAVARTLYCPLCVGKRLDTCEIPLCMDMKAEIAKQLAKGRTPEEIRQYFVAQYGPVVLGEPPRKGFNWLAWIIPFVVLAGAAAFVLLRVRQWSRQPVAAGTSSPPGGEAEGEEEDEYTRQVERELSEWE